MNNRSEGSNPSVSAPRSAMRGFDNNAWRLGKTRVHQWRNRRRRDVENVECDKRFDSSRKVGSTPTSVGSNNHSHVRCKSLPDA